MRYDCSLSLSPPILTALDGINSLFILAHNSLEGMKNQLEHRQPKHTICHFSPVLRERLQLIQYLLEKDLDDSSVQSLSWLAAQTWWSNRKSPKKEGTLLCLLFYPQRMDKRDITNKEAVDKWVKVQYQWILEWTAGCWEHCFFSKQGHKWLQTHPHDQPGGGLGGGGMK